jgi:iron complex transport system substrate-binding protein
MKLLVLAAMTASAAADCRATAPSVASYFSVEVRDGFKIVQSTQAGCSGAYVLYPRDTAQPDLGSQYKYFATPLERVALTQTVSNTFLEILGVSSAAAVISSYTTSACLHKRVKDGLAVEYVGPANPWGGGNDTEHAMQMESVDAVFTDPFGASGFEAGDFAAKTICTAETYETEQLSQAEWIKFYGLFFEKEEEAGVAMCGTASRFACGAIAANAVSLSQGPTYQPPKVAIVSKDYLGDYKINTVPKAMALIRHAGAVFPDLSAHADRLVMHYSGDYEEGYRFNASTIAEFHEALAMLDVVIDETYPYEQTQESIATAYGIPEGVEIPAFVSGRVYTLDKTMSHHGLASDIYESAIPEPDVYLADLIAIIHADGLSAAEAASTTSFVRHAATGAVSFASSEMCAESWPVRAASCDIAFTNLQDESGLLIPEILVDPTNQNDDDTISGEPQTATLFTVCERDGYKVVQSTQSGCNSTYVLYPRGSAQPDLGSQYKYFATPLERVALTQTVSNTFLEILGVSSAAAVISSYTTSACLHKRVEDGLAVEYVGPANPWGGGNDTEHAMQMESVDAVFTDPFGASGFEAGDFAAKTICTAETYESGQLSQAEWIKFYGLFFEKEEEAATALCGTSSRFGCSSIAANSVSLSQGPTYQPPKVAILSKDYLGDYKINTVPKAMALLRHAGAVFPDLSAYADRLVMHYSGDYEEGYRFNASTIAEFHEALAMFDVVIDETYPYEQTQESIATAYGIPEGVEVPAFVSGRVYTLDKTMSHHGLASDIYESAIAQPDVYLADLIAVIYPEGLSAAEAASATSFVRHAASGSVTFASSDTCTETSTRAGRSPVCADTAGQLTLITSVGVIEDTCQTVTAVTYPQCPAMPGGAPGGGDENDEDEEEDDWVFPAGAIAGITVGGVILIAVVIGIAIWCCVKAGKKSGAEGAVAKV